MSVFDLVFPRMLTPDELEEYVGGPIVVEILKDERGLRPTVTAPRCTRYDRVEVDALLDAMRLDRDKGRREGRG